MAVAIYIFTSVIFLGVAAIASLMAYKRGFFKSAVKLGITVICLVLSIVLSIALSASLSDLVGGLLNDFIGTSFGDVLEASPTLKALIFSLPSVLLCPFLFVLIFFLAKFVLDVIFKIISAFAIKKKELVVFKGSKYIPIAFGVLITFICFFVLAVPFNGIITVTADVYEATSDYLLDEGPTKDYVDGAVDGLNNNPVKIVTYNLGGKALFDTLTSFEYDGTTYSLGEELTTASKTVTALLPLAEKDIQEWGENEALVFEELADSIGSSKLFTSISAELLSGASVKWSEGEEFAGVALPESETIKPVLNVLLNCFVNATPETVKEDLDTVGQMISILVRKGALSTLSGDADTKQILDAVSAPGMLSEVFGVLYDNERLAPIVPELTELSMKTAADALGVPTKQEQKDDLYNDIASKLNDASQIVDESEREKAYEKAVKDVFKKFGINADSEAQQVLAGDLSNVFEGRNDVAADEVGNYFEGLNMISADGGDSDWDSLVLKFGQEKVENVFGKDKETAETDITDRNSTVTLLGNCSDGNKDSVLSIAPSNDLISDNPTVESLVDGINFENATKEDVMDLGDLLTNLVGSVGGVMDNMNSLDSNASSYDKLKNLDAKELGSAFDAVSGNPIIGDPALDLLDQGIKSTTGMDIGIRDIVDNSAEGVENSNYADVLGNLQNTMEVMDTINDTNVSHEEKVRKVDEFMENLDSASATSISKLINEDVVVNMGVSESKAESSTEFVKTVFVELGKTEDEDGEEAEAVKYLFDVAMSSKDGEGELFGESGRIENADSFVDKVLDSQVAINSIVASSTDESGNYVKDPLGVSGKINENDREDLTAALDRVASDPETSEEHLEVLDDIANMFGVEWTMQ